MQNLSKKAAVVKSGLSLSLKMMEDTDEVLVKVLSVTEYY